MYVIQSQSYNVNNCVFDSNLHDIYILHLLIVLFPLQIASRLGPGGENVAWKPQF